MTVKEVDIVYLYEHVARELDVACALAAVLEREHHMRVEIIQWPVGFPEVVTRFHPRLVVLPYCYTEDHYRNLLAFWRESVFLNLSWEQLLYFGNRNAKTPRGDFSLRHVIHHTWSEQNAELLKKIGIPEEHIMVNGQPAYTLYDEPYRRYFASRSDLAERYDLDNSSRWVFFPENYNWAFYPESQIRQIIKEGQMPGDVKVMRDYCEQSLTEMLHWCAEAAREDCVEIILRPRPSTSLKDFLGVVHRVLPEVPPRFHVIKQETVREWILASDVVVSSHSTSLIEAAVAGKYAGIVAPFPIPAQLHADWHDLPPHITTQEEFMKVIKSSPSQPGDLEQWARESMMAHGDAIRNLAGFFAKIVSGEVTVPEKLPQEFVASWFKIIPPQWIWSLYRRFKLFIRFPANFGIEPEYAKDYMSRKKIRARIQKWIDLLAVERQQ